MTYTDTEGREGSEFLSDLFTDTYCEECGGDAPEHTPVPFLGNFFARCDYPRTGAGRRYMREAQA